MEKLLDKKEVASYFKVSTKTIENWVEKKGLNETKVGGAVRFKISDVENFRDGK